MKVIVGMEGRLSRINRAVTSLTTYTRATPSGSSLVGVVKGLQSFSPGLTGLDVFVSLKIRTRPSGRAIHFPSLSG